MPKYKVLYLDNLEPFIMLLLIASLYGRQIDNREHLLISALCGAIFRFGFALRANSIRMLVSGGVNQALGTTHALFVSMK